MELVKPNLKYKDSFSKALEEYKAEERKISLRIPESSDQSIKEYIQQMVDEEIGLNLPEGYVAHTKLWLVDNNEYIGDIDIRHSLTGVLLNAGGHIGYEIRPSKRKMGYGTKMLQMALPIAKNLGINKVLITCNDDNIGSAKIIEKNGGILEDKREEKGNLKRRYWIDNK
jgi:predicted acetyltransferase